MTRRARGIGGLSAGLLALLWTSTPAAVGQSATEPRIGSERASDALERAEALAEEGRLAAARALIERLLEERPTSLEALRALDRVVARAGDEMALVAPAERAVELAPERSALRRFWIGALAEAGLADSARSAARRWVEDAPREAAAHLALAEALAAVGHLPEAVAALQRGRSAAGEVPALARALSGLHLREGAWEAAATEWLRLLALGPAGASAVVEQLTAWSGDPAPALAALWREVASEAPDPVRAEAAVYLAFELGQPASARRIVRQVIVEPEGRLAGVHLAEARRRGAWREAAWAAGRLAERTSGPERARWRAAGADMALRAGDTLAARSAFRALAREAPRGSESRGLALSRLFSLRSAERGGADDAERYYRELLSRHAIEDAEAARLSAVLALALVRDGRDTEARRLLGRALSGARTPEGGAALRRALALLDVWDGHPADAVEHLDGALGRSGLDPEARTRWIRLRAALESADSTTVAGYGRALGRLFRDPGAVDVADLLLGSSDPRTANPGPQLLALGADALMEAGRPGDAAALWRELIRRHPGTPEAASAMLSLSRTSMEADPEAARRWLRRVIVEQPNSAVSPMARRLLAELSEAGHDSL